MAADRSMPNFRRGSVSPARPDWNFSAASATSRFITDAKSAMRVLISSSTPTEAAPPPPMASVKAENWTAIPLNSLLLSPTEVAAFLDSASTAAACAPKVTRTALADSFRSDAEPDTSLPSAANPPPIAVAGPSADWKPALTLPSRVCAWSSPEEKPLVSERILILMIDDRDAISGHPLLRFIRFSVSRAR